MTDTISWFATIATIIAATVTAGNFGSKITGYGFIVFTIGALCWAVVGAATHQPALMWTNLILFLLDLFGVWRWLGRETEVEQGARAATEASSMTNSESLFPVSVLTSAPIGNGTTEFGQCINAMAGCRSGKIQYLVVSQGGVAGVGETLRRLPWEDVNADGESLSAIVSAEMFERLDILPRDQWPGR